MDDDNGFQTTVDLTDRKKRLSNQDRMPDTMLEPQVNETNSYSFNVNLAQNIDDITSVVSGSEEEYDVTNSDSTIFGNTEEAVEIEKPSVVPNKMRFKSIDFLLASLDSAMNTLEFDKALVIQSQVAGSLNSASSDIQKSIESLEEELKLQIDKYTNLKSRILPGIESNLKKTRKKVKNITSYLQAKYPVEYSKGRSKILENLTEDEEGLFL